MPKLRSSVLHGAEGRRVGRALSLRVPGERHGGGEREEPACKQRGEPPPRHPALELERERDREQGEEPEQVALVHAGLRVVAVGGEEGRLADEAGREPDGEGGEGALGAGLWSDERPRQPAQSGGTIRSPAA